MSLPPLPKPDDHDYHAITQVRVDYYNATTLQAYGQQCRDAALKEAADALRKTDISGIASDQGLLNYTALLLTQMADYLENLK